MIDWAQVGELRNEVGADDFEEVVHLFLAEVEDVIALLQSRVESGLQADAGDPLEAQLHFLRGSALSLGFTTFCSLCLTAERKAADGLATASVPHATLHNVGEVGHAVSRRDRCDLEVRRMGPSPVTVSPPCMLAGPALFV